MTQSKCDNKGVHETSYHHYMPGMGAICTIDAWPAQQAATVAQSRMIAAQSATVAQSRMAVTG